MLIHNDDAFAAMLLTLRLPQGSVALPLSPREYHGICKRSGAPGKLLGMDVRQICAAAQVDESVAYRIHGLLSRFVPLSALLEKCAIAGIEMIAVCEDSYPARLRSRMGMEAPPVLFTCGNLNLLEERGAAALGISVRRDFRPDAQAFLALAQQNHTVTYSDGGDGLGRACEDAACLLSGKSVSFISHSFSEHILRPDTARRIANGEALAISAREPDAGFDPERARERAICLCALTDFSALFCLERSEGPLWDGLSASAALKRIPRAYVRWDENLEGNQALISRGCMPFHDVCELPFSRPEIVDGYQLSFLS